MAKREQLARVYYQVVSNDCCPQSDEISTLKEAKRIMREYIKQDEEEFGWQKDECVHYYIMKYTETEDTIYYEEIDPRPQR